MLRSRPYDLRTDLRTRLCYDAKIRAKRKNLHFSIRPEQIHIPKYCPVFGIELKPSKGYPSDNSPTLDRVNNDFGYVPWNICVISYKANMLKGNGTLDEFRALVRYLEAKLPNVPMADEPYAASADTPEPTEPQLSPPELSPSQTKVANF